VAELAENYWISEENGRAKVGFHERVLEKL